MKNNEDTKDERNENIETTKIPNPKKIIITKNKMNENANLLIFEDRKENNRNAEQRIKNENQN